MLNSLKTNSPNRKSVEGKKPIIVLTPSQQIKSCDKGHESNLTVNVAVFDNLVKLTAMLLLGQGGILDGPVLSVGCN